MQNQGLIAADLCARLCGLAADEMLIGVTPHQRHEALVSDYLNRAAATGAAPHAVLVADLRAALARGARDQAADLFLALRRLPPPRSGAPMRRVLRSRRRAALRHRVTFR
jgi:hypothetical protein